MYESAQPTARLVLDQRDYNSCIGFRPHATSVVPTMNAESGTQRGYAGIAVDFVLTRATISPDAVGMQSRRSVLRNKGLEVDAAERLSGWMQRNLKDWL